MNQTAIRFIVLFVVSINSALAAERVYYIAAEEIVWDYAPEQKDLMLNTTLNEDQEVFVKNSDKTIGSRYKKALFRAYHDASFTTLKPRPKHEAHLGLLGPLIRAEVGDTIEVVFRNRTSRPFSIHPHGVFYNKSNEGSMSNDGTSTSQRLDDKVTPGNSYTYRWEVPESAGPGPNDGSSVVWLYQSHVDAVKDSNSGLVGAIIITAKGQANEDGTPKDVDREFVNLFTVMDENESWYLNETVEKYMRGFTDLENETFVRGNLMHTINGFVYGNLPGLEMQMGEKVRWHLIALGSKGDNFSPGWHGHTGAVNGRRTDVVELLPASMKSLDMTINNLGTWMYHCHVNNNLRAGMTALYHVTPKVVVTP